MVVEREVLPLLLWLFPGEGAPGNGLGALLFFLVTVFCLALAGILFGFLKTSIRFGPGEAFYRTAASLFTGFQQLTQMSPRRIGAMSLLAFQEAIRRRVLVAFVAFVLILLFAGWYLDTGSDHPARIYIGTVLWGTNFLTLVMALFLSTFSLPNDITNRTIYTVVTKPVRAGEIVVGRIFGFSAVGTIMLVVMGVLSYVFVVRGVAHQHRISAADVEKGRTQENIRHHHKHEFTLDSQGKGHTDIVAAHRHRVEAIGNGENITYQVGSAEGALQARVPIYGKLSFLDRQGRPTAKGINVGNEWTYRSFFEGSSPAAAIWRFQGITPQAFPEELFPEALPMELNIRVFRTHKGDIERGILGSIVLVNPDPQQKPQRMSEPIQFIAREFVSDLKRIPRQLKGVASDGSLYDIDLFKDLVHNGELEVRIQCLEPGQYYGAAQADVYFRAAENPFWWNFVKGYLGIWCQMVLLTSFGVMFSTFLSGAVAMLATGMSFIMGRFSQFIVNVNTGETEGGGPIESAIRLVEGSSVVVPLDDTLGTTIIQSLDRFLMVPMTVLANIMPNPSQFSNDTYVAYGYNIETALVSQHLLITLAYVLVISSIGYFLLKTREIAA